MKKIVVSFNSPAKIQKLKKIMKQVYVENNDNIPEIVKFDLRRELAPCHVDYVELEIKKVVGKNIVVNIPKTSLTFFTAEPPYSVVSSNSNIHGRYIILPWNIRSSTGREELKDMISKIPIISPGLKYMICLVGGAAASSDNVSVTDNITDIDMSELSFDDNLDELLTKIQQQETDLLRTRAESAAEIAKQQTLVSQKDLEITRLQAEVSQLTDKVSDLDRKNAQKQSEITALSAQISSLQSTAYSQSSQLATYTGNRNQVYTERNSAPNYGYRLTNFTGRVNIAAGIDLSRANIQVLGDSTIGATANVTFTPS